MMIGGIGSQCVVVDLFSNFKRAACERSVPEIISCGQILARRIDDCLSPTVLIKQNKNQKNQQHVVLDLNLNFNTGWNEWSLW